MNVPCHSFCKQLSWTHANIFLSFSMQTQSGWRTAERYATPPVDKIRSARSIGLAALSSASPSVANRRTLSQCRELAKDLNDVQKVRMDGDGEATVKIKKRWICIRLLAGQARLSFLDFSLASCVSVNSSTITLFLK